MKLLIITNIPNPYRIPLFNELNKELQKNNHQLHIAFGTDTYKRRKFELNLSDCRFNYTILSSKKIPLKKSEGVLITYTGIRRLLKTYKPDKIIVAGFSLATLKLFILSYFRKTNFVIWSGVIQSAGRSQSTKQRVFRKMLVKKAAGGLSYGTKSKEYLVNMGMPANKIRIAINTVDTSFFRNETNALKKRIKPSNQFRKKLLYVGYLTKGKRIDLLLYLVNELSKTRNDFYLQIIGDGPEMANLKELTITLKIEKQVEFSGFIQKPDLPQHLATAYTFLFPSEYDIWGLVLVEAMAAGIPCIASEKAGATPDVIIHEKNGFSCNFEKKETVKQLIYKLLDNKQLQKKMSVNAINFIQDNVSLKNSVNGFLEVLYEL